MKNKNNNIIKKILNNHKISKIKTVIKKINKTRKTNKKKNRNKKK